MVVRFKLVFHKSIGWKQSSFVKCKEIIDNYVLAMECFKSLSSKKHKSKSCAIKLNMGKVFDRVETDYIRLILKALGFSSRRCSLVGKCIFTTTLSILINCIFFVTSSHLKVLRQVILFSILIFISSRGFFQNNQTGRSS